MGANAHFGGRVDPWPGVFRWVGPSGRSLLTVNGFHYSMFDQFLYAWDRDWVVNPTPAHYRGPIAIPEKWRTDEHRVRCTRFRYDERSEILNASAFVGVVEVPAYGWENVPFDHLNRCISAETNHDCPYDMTSV